MHAGVLSKASELREDAYEYIRRIGLREGDALKYPDQLSGGMQQRVAIAQALMTGPRMRDPGTRREMQQLIRDLWGSTGTTILFVTHNTDEALRMGTRIVLLAKESGDQGSRVALVLRCDARRRRYRGCRGSWRRSARWRRGVRWESAVGR